jgi:hypothetical protein
MFRRLTQTNLLDPSEFNAQESGVVKEKQIIKTQPIPANLEHIHFPYWQ